MRPGLHLREGDLVPPLGFPGGPCHVIQRIREEVRSPKLQDELIEDVERGFKIDNAEASKIYDREIEKGRGLLSRIILTSHAQYRMDQRGITVTEIRMALESWSKEWEKGKQLLGQDVRKQKARELKSKAQQWKNLISRREPIWWADSRINLNVVFVTDGKRVARVVTAYWRGQSDPHPKDEEACKTATYTPPAGEMPGVETVVSPKSKKNLPTDIDREKERALPPGAAHPRSPNKTEAPKDDKGSGFGEDGTFQPGYNVPDGTLDIQLYRFPGVPGEDYGVPYGTGPNTSNRTMEGSLGLLEAIWGDKLALYKPRRPWRRQRKERPPSKRREHKRYYRRNRNRILRRMKRWYNRVRRLGNFKRLRKKRRENPDRYRRRAFLQAPGDIAFVLGKDMLLGYVVGVSPDEGVVFEVSGKEGEWTLPVMDFLNSVVLLEDDDIDALIDIIDQELGDDVYEDISVEDILSRAEMVGLDPRSALFMDMVEDVSGRRSLEDLSPDDLEMLDEALADEVFFGLVPIKKEAVPKGPYRPRAIGKRRYRRRGAVRMKRRRQYRRNRIKEKRRSKQWYKRRRRHPAFKRRQKMRRRNPARFKMRRRGSVLTAPEIAFVTGPEMDLGYIHNVSPMTGMVTFQLDRSNAEHLHSLPVMVFLNSVVFLSEEDVDAMFLLIDMEVGEEAYEDFSVGDAVQCAEMYGADPSTEEFFSWCMGIVGKGELTKMTPDELTLVTGALVTGVMEGGGRKRRYEEIPGTDIGDPVEVDPKDDVLYFGEVDLPEDRVRGRVFSRTAVGDILLYHQQGPEQITRDRTGPESTPGREMGVYVPPSSHGPPNEYKYVRDDKGPVEIPGGQPSPPEDSYRPPPSHRVVPPNYGNEKYVTAGTLLYHVPPDGRTLTARPLHGGKFRHSETQEMKEELRINGFPENSPVVWLSPRRPVSRMGSYFVINKSRLDQDRIIPTFDANGTLLHVGDIPDRAILRFQGSTKTAATMEEIAILTEPVIHERSRGVKVKPYRFIPKKGLWLFRATGSKGEQYHVRIKAALQEGVKNLRDLEIKVSCSCPFWRWQGPEHWARNNDYLYGRPRGTASKPVIRDPKGQKYSCKHVLACFNLARHYRVASTSTLWPSNAIVIFEPWEDEWARRIAERWLSRQ